MKPTQYRKIVDYLRRRGTATTWELMQVARSTCPHKRISEMTHYDGRLIYPYGKGRIVRDKVLRAGRLVTEYRLLT
jgi:hypothetical protein